MNNIFKPAFGKSFSLLLNYVKALLAILMLFCSFSAHASACRQTQPIIINGKVVDDNQMPIAGVTVQVVNTSVAVATDTKGNFSIRIPSEKARLIFTHIGYQQQELTAKQNMVVQLLTISDNMQDVVVVAYGSQRKSDVTGSISSVKSNSLKDVPVISLEELLKGQAAGLQSSVGSGTPGSASNVNIRGVSSISASTQPLYVVDGLPIPGQSIETGFSEARTGLDFLNPQDIESVEILKDASATSIYGARGANGVILITTKSGKLGVSTTTFSSSVGITTLANKIDMMTTRQIQEYWTFARVRDGFAPRPLDDDTLLNTNTDWQKVSMQNAFRQNYNLTFQGGQPKLKYYLSLDYLDQQGLLRYTKYNKYSVRGNMSSQVTTKLSVENRFTLARTKNDGTFTGGEGGNPNTLSAMQKILQAPTFRKPSQLYTPATDPETGESYVDPIIILRDLSDDISVTNITEQLTLKYKLIPGLDLQTMGAVTYRFFNNEQYQGPDYARIKSDTKISASVRNNTTDNFIMENTATYKKTFGGHDFTLLIGNTIQQETTKGTRIDAVDFPNTTTGTNALQNANDVTVSSFKQQWQLASFFGRLNYSLKNRYLLTATIRRDGSSKLAEGSKWGMFPSLAIGWNVNQESFFKSKLISNLKFRGSWGQIGNSDIGVYNTISTISTGTGAMNNELLPYYYLSSYGDPNLKWEISEQTNIGADIGFLNNQISLTVDIYEKKTKDLLLYQPTSLGTGYNSYLTNVGSMSNKGIEITVNYNVLHKKTFDWSTNFNCTMLRNEVTDLGNVGSISIGQTVDGKSPRYLSIGKSIGSYYLVKTAGVWQTDELTEAALYGAKPGDWKYIDQNGDHVINNGDRVFTGDAIADFSFGFSNTFRYKKFDLQMLISGDFGGQTLNAVKPNLWLARGAFGAAYNLKAWSPSNPTNKLAAPTTVYNSDFLSDAYLESADIVRFQTIRLGYRFGRQRRNQRSLYVYLSGNNIWSFSRYEGYDPEVGNGINRGIDRYAYPRGRTYTMGAQFSF